MCGGDCRVAHIHGCRGRPGGTAAEPPAGDAVLTVFNRDIVTFRAPLMGVSAHDRARRAQTRIEEQLDGPGTHKVTMQAIPLGTLVQIDGASSFMVVHWFVTLLLLYEWISLVLRQFPYTRLWGERLR